MQRIHTNSSNVTGVSLAVQSIPDRRWGLSLLAFAASLMLAPSVLANPAGGNVAAGSATIGGQGSTNVTVNQATPKVVINWDSFSIDAGQSTTFVQPDANSVSLNRVTGIDPSSIQGNLSANGTVILVNRNGIVFGETAKVDVGGLVATTHDISNQAFMAGGPLRFDQSGSSNAAVVNKGSISIKDSGLAAFVATHVANDGAITARFGKVALGAGSAFTLDLYGDNLVTFAVGDELGQSLTGPDGMPLKALVENSGRISASGGRVTLTAAAARSVVNQSVNVSGIIEANTAEQVGGVIVLKGSGNVTTEATASLSASGTSGGAINVTGDDVHIGGLVSADGGIGRLSRFDAAAGNGGSIEINGGRYTSLDGTISASGRTGGSVTTTAAGNFALNGAVKAKGTTGSGGAVGIAVAGETWEASGSSIDVSGANGGTIRNITRGKFVSSANYLAQGTAGNGGQIDVTGSKMFLLSSSYDASGYTAGGVVRIGGEYQGGKNLVSDQLANASEVAANDGVKINVSANGAAGTGGTAIIWSDNKTTFLGHVYATGGILTGNGGLVEASSANDLIWRGSVDTARNGQRGGTLLLDPKNITIADGSFDQMALILGAFYSDQPIVVSSVGPGDQFGSAVSLDGTRLAVGAIWDDGATNTCIDCGAIYLFNFADTSFSGGSLTARIGSGYSGGNNIDFASVLSAGDRLGGSVSLSDTRLVASAYQDDGVSENCGDCGAVYLFNFLDSAFGGGSVTGRIGAGYNGARDINLAGVLDGGDLFGYGVSMDGTRLAVGSLLGDGAANSCGNCGEVSLFTFADTSFNGGTLVGHVGGGYTGANDINLAGILTGDSRLGGSVSLDGTHLAAGANGDQGLGGSCGQFCGAVYLFSFADTAFNGGALSGRIGHGYAGAADVNIAGMLSTIDQFGYGVSLDGNRIAVGVWADDGATNGCTDCGAVYLFNFTPGSIAGGVLTGRIGDGYAGPNDINLAGTLNNSDLFGSSVALDGSRLAVGAVLDDGANNTCTDCGAVYLFRFAGADFAGGIMAGRLGDGYTDLANAGLMPSLGNADVFGSSVSLDGTRLAVGAIWDDGATNTCIDCGAVYLFNFADNSFSGGSLLARIGSGYSGGNSINLGGMLQAGDRFGGSVSLSDTRLVASAYLDDGASENCGDCGAVYLFNFADTAFGNGSLTGRIGAGYNGARDINLAGTLDVEDLFGYGVSLDGTRLAIGSLLGDGATNSCGNCGEISLFTFADTSFNGGTLVGHVGGGYTGANDINLAGILTGDSRLGGAVSLDGMHLVAGAYGDQGLAGSCGAFCGAVYLFNYADNAFGGGTLSGRIGHGYTGVGDVNLAGSLQAIDQFGYGVSLDGNRLAVGSWADDGASDSCLDCGAVYLFSFTPGSISGGALTQRIGVGYSGPNDINLAGTLNNSDLFGSSVALDGSRLAVGAVLDDGANNTCTDCGAVYLFTEPGLPGTLYGDSSSSSITISPAQLKALLDAGNSVILQASNDVTLDANLIISNASGNGGALTLQAGRSVLLNADIFTDNGDLTIIGNDLLANGVLDTERDAGAAVITMASGATIDAGTGTVTIEMRNGAGKTNANSGAITLGSITASTMNVHNGGLSGANVVLQPGTLLTASGSGDAVVLAANDNFINNAGSGAINLTGSGRFLVYSRDWTNAVVGGLLGSNLYNRAYNTNLPSSITQSGNRFVYALQPVLSVAADNASRFYGDSNPAFTAAITGLVNGDAAIYAYSGAAGFTTATTATSGVNTYVGDIAANIGTLLSDVGYGFAFVAGDLQINPATLTVTAANKNRTYGDANPLLTGSITGFKNLETAAVLTTGPTYATLATPTSSVAGGPYAITASGAAAANYVFSYVPGILTINPAVLTVTADSKTKFLGQVNPPLTATITGFKNGETTSVITGLQITTTAIKTSPVGTYPIVPSGASAANYVFNYVNGVMTILKKGRR